MESDQDLGTAFGFLYQILTVPQCIVVTHDGYAKPCPFGFMPGIQRHSTAIFGFKATFMLFNWACVPSSNCVGAECFKAVDSPRESGCGFGALKVVMAHTQKVMDGLYSP